MKTLSHYRAAVLREKMREAGTPKDVAALRNLVESRGHVFPKVPKSTSIMIWPVAYRAPDMTERKAWRIFHGSERTNIFSYAFDTVTYQPIDEDAAAQRELNILKSKCKCRFCDQVEVNPGDVCPMCENQN